jgi:hypothetical protein
MLTSALEQNADIAMWNSCNMYSPGYRDQHCAPGSHRQLVLKSMVQGNFLIKPAKFQEIVSIHDFTEDYSSCTWQRRLPLCCGYTGS